MTATASSLELLIIQLCLVLGTLTGIALSQEGCSAVPPNDDSCCKSNTCRKIPSCSPPVSSRTAAILTQNSFEEGGDGGGPSKCDDRYLSNKHMIVALSTGWFRSRCNKSIVIHGNGGKATATVVDECDSRNGCDTEHADQPPCGNNIVDASNAVWEALGVSQSDSQYGYMEITWEDAT